MRWILLFLLWSNVCIATTYQVAVDGSGDYTTLAGGQSVLADGDTIQLNRGDAWVENITVNKNNITIEAYGSGAKPIINGKLNRGIVKNALSISNISFISAGLRCIDITAGGVGLTVDACDFDGNNYDVPLINAFGAGGDYLENVTISNCTFTNTFDQAHTSGLAISFQRKVKNILIENCTIKNQGEFGIQIYSDWYTEQNTDWIVRGCTVTNDEFPTSRHGGINIGQLTDNVVVENNYVSNCRAGIEVDSHNLGADEGYLIKNNIVYNCIYHISILANNDPNSPTIHPVGMDTTNNVKVYNNTVVFGIDSVAGIVFTSYANKGGAGHIVRNNIVVTDETFWANILITDAEGGTCILEVDSDYNNFYCTAGAIRFYGPTGYDDPLTFAQWKALGYDAHSIEANPLLRSATDYRLQKTSPCIRAGVSLPEVTDDYEGTPRFSGVGGSNSIGAYEYYKAKIRNATLRHSTI